MSTPWNWRPAGPSLTRRPASLIRLEGSDALRVLHGQTSAAIEGARPGQWIPTCCITPTARLRALAEVLVDAGGAWLAVTAGDGAQVHQALDRVLFPADRVRLLAPQPGWLVEPVPGETEQLETAEAGRWQELAGGGGWQLGQGRLGRALLLASDTALPAAWAGRTPLGAREAERWRIQGGVPAVPGEINDDHNPFELGLADRVSLRKGCYVGQETLAKLATYDGVRQLLHRWHWQAEPGVPAPEVGQVLQELQTEATGSGDATAGAGTRLGVISSALELESGDRIGLALVRRRALGQPQLQAGSGGAAPRLQLSAPDGFVMPPVGPGGEPTAQAS
ncbi:folate-binding protein YgfZ [Cyanobium sp. CH-040]|uniref:CAF17-like 4Fe-4S cluster assembly/insertion protein YgfZ n=1 Tax=Cyanobium sp. CH-040 TaxID=2823708 RepID=UPI0020CB7D06|nr:folate-binding protein [Cyanobium sp. CH-040]MCP9927397.1 folate-binding protein [Cyanobium sp. CH-040]